MRIYGFGLEMDLQQVEDARITSCRCRLLYGSLSLYLGIGCVRHKFECFLGTVYTSNITLARMSEKVLRWRNCT